MVTLSWDNLRHIQEWASFDTAVSLSIAMNQPLDFLLKRDDCPEHLLALFELPIPNDDLQINHMFVPLRHYPLLWTLLPPARALEMLDLVLTFFLERRPEVVPYFSKHDGPSRGKHARACVTSLLKYRGVNALLRNLQEIAYSRLATVEKPRDPGCADMARALLVHSSCHDEALKHLLDSLASQHPDVLATSWRLAQIMQARLTM